MGRGIANIAENHLHPIESRWFAVYTAYKREKVVAKMLDKKGVEVFLPLQTIHKQYQRSKKIVELPLFNCILFVRINQSQYVQVLETEHILRFIKIGQNLISIPAHEIETIRCIIGAQVDIQVEIFDLQEGEPIQVIAGGLSGLEGKFLKQESKYNFLVELEMLGYQMRMHVRPEHLRRNHKHNIGRKALA